MKDTRITLAKRASAEIEERKSIFIGTAAPVTSEEEARAFIDGVKKEYYDARHNVFAYLLSEGSVSRFTDDGEPKGSAGIPTLNVLKMSGAVDLAVVVTRYFGGILLGTGGLVRAYSAAAKAALDAAGFAVMRIYSVMEIRCTYSEYQLIVSKLSKAGAVEDSSDFAADVTMTVSALKEDEEAVKFLITQLTSGKASANTLRYEERPQSQ